VDIGGDGVDLFEVKKWLIDANGYMVTNNKLTSGSETMEVVLRIKVK
jgi:hypothetical protein